MYIKFKFFVLMFLILTLTSRIDFSHDFTKAFTQFSTDNFAQAITQFSTDNFAQAITQFSTDNFAQVFAQDLVQDNTDNANINTFIENNDDDYLNELSNSENSSPESIPIREVEPNSQPLSLTISPSTLILDTDPGKSISSSFQVFNNSTETEYLKISKLTFTANQTGNAPILQEFSDDDETKDWLTFNNQIIKVEPKTWSTVQVNFSPPDTASLSYYYAIVISRQSTLEPNEGESVVVGAPALLTLVTVRSPYAKRELQLKSFRSTKKVFEFLPVEFELTVQNTGNVHLAPIGNIFINGLKQKDIGLIEINRNNGLILPGSTRTYTLKWSDGFPAFVDKQVDGKFITDKNGQPIKKLEWDFSKANLFRIGKYTGHLLFIYDNGARDIPTEANVSFWVLPYRIIAVLLLVLTLMSLGIFIPINMLLKKVKKRK